MANLLRSIGDWVRNDPIGQYVEDRFGRWRAGSREGQIAVLLVLIGFTLLIFVGGLLWYTVFPSPSYLVPLLIGGLALRWRPLAALAAVAVCCAVIAATVMTVRTGPAPGRLASLVVLVMAVMILLFSATRNRSGLPATLGDAMLMDLRDRLQAQGVVPQLPDGWQSQSATRSAGGSKFAGDFLVANLSDDQRHLEMVLVDVCGKGVAAGTQSLQLAGALGGLIGSLPPIGLFAAANNYLLRQEWEDGFATAVHMVVDLHTGDYSIISAGHPPALRYVAAEGQWQVDGARGLALGIAERPEFAESSGRLEPGEGLMFYTDGVVESRDESINEGIECLRTFAGESMADGFEGLPGRILAKVGGGDDDRAVLVLSRHTDPTPPTPV